MAFWGACVLFPSSNVIHTLIGVIYSKSAMAVIYPLKEDLSSQPSTLIIPIVHFQDSKPVILYMCTPPPPRWILLESPYFPRQQLAMVLRNLSINPSISTYRCGLTKCEMTITQPFTCLIVFKYIFLLMQTGLTLSFILSIYILQSSREKLARYYSLPSYKNVTQFSPYQYYEPKSSSCSECAI